MQYLYVMPFRSAPPNPQVVSMAAVMRLAATAEQAGFAAVAFTEHPAPAEDWRLGPGGHDCLDPFVGLTAAAAATRQLRLLTYLVVLPYRNPLLLAKTAASLDALSGGRLLLGLGAGYLEEEFAALGVPFTERNALFDEGLKVLKQAFSGQPVTYTGRHFSANAVRLLPQPAQRPHPPLWIGGNSQASLRRVAEQAQGWMAMPSSSSEARWRRSAVLEDLAALKSKIAWIHRRMAAIGRKEKISVQYPLNNRDDGGGFGAAADMARRLRDCGVDWCGWTSQAPTLDGMCEEIQRFGAALPQRPLA